MKIQDCDYTKEQCQCEHCKSVRSMRESIKRRDRRRDHGWVPIKKEKEMSC